MIKDRRITLPISSITEETDEVKTFTFRTDIPSAPGQFIMLTDFNGGEKPFSISGRESLNGEMHLSVTIKRIGAFTSRLFTMKEGDFVSIRGAYGSSFFIPARDSAGRGGTEPEDFKAVLCGGGFGLPPLFYLAGHLLAAGVRADNIRVISAARTEDELLFEDRFDAAGLPYIGAAETLSDAENASIEPDGCGRICGTAADALSAVMADDGYGSPDFLYASGSDLMMKSLVPQIPESTEYQFLFERYMKCAIGICGSCAVDPTGLRICTEGPALRREQVEQLEDFGVYKRAASGSLEYFHNRMGAR